MIFEQITFSVNIVIVITASTWTACLHNSVQERLYTAILVDLQGFIPWVGQQMVHSPMSVRVSVGEVGW